MKKNFTIGVVVWFFPKISETFVLNKIIELKKAGHSVKIFAVKNPRTDIPKEDLKPENEIHELVKKFQLSRAVSYGNPSQLYRRIRSQVARGELDVVIFQFPDLAEEILKRGALGIPTFTIFHDLQRISRKGRELFAKKFCNAFEKSTRILAISQFTINELKRINCPMDKVVFHPMGVDMTLFKFKERRIPEKRINLCMVGRMIPKKGFEYGIRAVKKFIDEHPTYKVQLHIVGDGVLMEPLKKLVERTGLFPATTFYGKLSQEKVIPILKGGSILIVPSITTKEGKRERLPVVILEALSCGLPVIASKHAAIPELRTAGCPSLVLVKEKSTDEIAQAIHHIAARYKLYAREYALRSRQTVGNRHDISILTRDLIALMINQLRINEINDAIKDFTSSIEKTLPKEVLSVAIVGSVARQERIDSKSDLDLIIIFKGDKSLSIESMAKLQGLLKKLQVESRLGLTPQIFTMEDLFQLISPVLLRDYCQNGVTIFGKNMTPIFSKLVDSIPRFKFDMAILKRMLFLRYLLRQKLSLQSLDDRKMAKNVLVLSGYYLQLEKGLYPRSGKEVGVLWGRYFRSSIPLLAYENLKDGTTNESFQRLTFDFVEKVCSRALKLLKTRYQNKRVYAAPF